MTIESHIDALKGPIVVAGASGFVGANLLKLLLTRRKDVFGAVRREKGWRLADVPDDQIVTVDLNDHGETRNFIEKMAPRTIFDLVSYGAYSFESDSDLIYKTNFEALTYRIGLLQGGPIAAYVHAGSSSEYGANSAAPDETDRCFPNSHYSVSKVCAATYLTYMGKTFAFPAVNLRLYSAYGPLEDSSRLIPNLVRKGLAGSFPPFVDRETSRDFVYIDDVSAAFIQAATRMQPDIYGEDFNIGSGRKTTVAELAEIARATFAIAEEPRFGAMPGRRWDLPDWYAKPDKAKALLGWEATTDLATGLRATAKWVAALDDQAFSTITKRTIGSRSRSISAIIACYKDAQAVPHMHRRLTEVFTRLGVDYEIIFVNDCSPDDCEEVILELTKRDSRVLGITHSRNFGSQMAFRSGMELASMQAVVLLDGDLQDPPELIEQFYARWVEGYDVVYGRRIKRDMPIVWGLLYKAFYRVFAAFSYVSIPLDAGDFSLIDRRVMRWMLQCRERDLFMRGIRAYVGFRQTGVDYVRPERMFGRSTNNLLKNIEWAKKGIFSFSNTPLTMLTSVGVALLGLSFLIGIASVLLKIFFPDLAAQGATTLEVTILAFGSLNLFAIGLVGEYVAKIMTEVKHRPDLIRSALVREGVVAEILPDDRKAPTLPAGRSR